MSILPARITEFNQLFKRFVKEFLESESGEHHRILYLEAATKARENYDRVCGKADRGEEYTDDLLRTFLPHGEGTYTRETDAWLHIAPCLQGAVQKKFEGSGWTKPEEWPKVAASILELVRTGVERPDEFAEACRTFADASHTTGFQSAFISPIINALRPELYSIVNMKPRIVLGWLTGTKYSDRIADYPDFNRNLRSQVDELVDTVEPHTVEGINRYQIFDFFTHWLVSIEKYFKESIIENSTEPESMSADLQTIMPDQATRQVLLPLFAEAVIYGASLNNRNWHLSVLKKYGDVARYADPEVTGDHSKVSPLRIRLISGSYLTASFHGDGFIAWVPRESLTDDIIRIVREEGGLLQELDFSSIPAKPVALRITPKLESWYRETIQPLHFAYINAASDMSEKSAWQETHRRDMIEAINAETGLDVPQPDYTNIDIARIVKEWIKDSPAFNSFETRREFEARARKMLDEKLGEMTSEDIREFLDLLVISRKDGDTLVKSRFGMALTGSLAQMIASDPEAFNKWVGLLWESDATNGLENFERFRKSGEVKGAGVSLPSLVLYLKDPETFGISIGIMIRALKELGYDVPKQTTTALEYQEYLSALHAFRTSHDLEPVMMDYVLWGLMVELGSSDPTTPITPISHDTAWIAAETNIPESTIEDWVAAIERKGQAILYGPPGTGKTFVAKKLAKHLSESGGGGLVQTIQFHPAYGYEDFIRGIRPRTDEENGQLRYEYISGAFMSFCEKAEGMGEETRCVMIIDEINRADLARVFGELMYLLEYRDEKVRIAGGKEFSIPLNVRIIGTMNTADRSIALVDHALRRRFAFLELQPNYDTLRLYHEKHATGFDTASLVDVLKRINDAIGDPHYSIGISYFLDQQVEEVLAEIWKTEIEPYLVEHFFDQPGVMQTFRWEEVGGELIDG